MGILLGIKIWYSESSKNMAVSVARSWLLKKNLHQSAEEQNFVSNDQNISGKTFRSDLLLQIMTSVITCSFIIIIIIIIIIATTITIATFTLNNAG
jgi:hypothetical protein